MDGSAAPAVPQVNRGIERLQKPSKISRRLLWLKQFDGVGPVGEPRAQGRIAEIPGCANTVIRRYLNYAYLKRGLG